MDHKETVHIGKQKITCFVGKPDHPLEFTIYLNFYIYIFALKNTYILHFTSLREFFFWPCALFNIRVLAPRLHFVPLTTFSGMIAVLTRKENIEFWTE